MSRIPATRARSALRHFWVPQDYTAAAVLRQEDGKLARALPALVAAAGKQLAIQNLVIVESCSLQPRIAVRLNEVNADLFGNCPDCVVRWLYDHSSSSFRAKR